MLYFLKNLEDFWGPLRLFEYQTFRAVMAGATALVLGFIIAPAIIKKLSPYLNPERQEDLLGDAAKKGQVATFGGLIILVSSLVSALLWVRFNTLVQAALLVYLGMGLVGFWDDVRKVRTKKDGISELEKTVGLTVVALAGIAVLLCDAATRPKAIEIWVPFIKTAVLSADTLPLWLGMLVAAVFFWLVTFASSNAVNLTDGMDGLSIGCVITTLLSLGIITYLTGHAVFAKYLQISRVSGAGELLVLTAAILGGCLVFLWHNAKPAEIYMGDVGALALGGYIGATAFICNQPLLLLVIGGVFVAEAGSALLQRVYFKMTKGKGVGGEGLRIFKVTPLHHHFQYVGPRPGALLKFPLKRWADEKIIVRFWLVSLLCGIIGLATLKLR